MGAMPYHVRLAELFLHQRQRTLSDSEVMEMTHCLAANASYCWELVMLQNCSQVAYEVGDMEWLHEICAKIEALEMGGEKKKKDGQKEPATGLIHNGYIVLCAATLGKSNGMILTNTKETLIQRLLCV
ncbi:DUF7667 family protein [Cohnella kolymensis]|uniref:DUF7667 family protein n=1 Tax=Cohnella kolymensis TaxID=1590652 RepID=UPI00190F4049|nr:hypothetical protein [Cohnella kolymensis]